MKSRIFFSLFLALVGASLLWFTELPDVLVTKPSQRQALSIFDRHGIVVRSFAPGEAYDWVTLSEVPGVFMELLLLAEDRNFYQHSGIDLISTLRSAWINLRHLQLFTGASTITQQVYRVQNDVPRTVAGKIQTMAGALKLELRYPKSEILLHYLNSLPFGKQIVGVKRASLVLFGKELSELSIPEMATLAVLPRSPSYLLSKTGEKSLTAKRNHLLDTFFLAGKISRDDLAFSKKVPVEISLRRNGWDNYHFVSKILAHPELAKFVQRGMIQTTIDGYLQQDVSSILLEQLKTLSGQNVNQGAVIVMDNRSGDILAYVGSARIDQTSGSHFDALQGRRQPGSTLKPFTYALALMKGHNLADTLPDIPSYYKTGLGQYLPRNYDKDFSGPRLMREALANSLNLPAVALADEIGVRELHAFLVNLGIPLDREPEHYGVGLTLGNAEITPIDLLRAYSVFSQGSYGIEPRWFLKAPVVSRRSPMPAEVAYLIRNVLSDDIARIEAFGAGNIFETPFELAAKTGTSTDFRDNWAVGMNRLYTTLVWVGNMDQKPMKKVSGITGAGPVLVEVMKRLMAGKYLPPEQEPAGLSRHEVCSLSGKKPGEFCVHRKVEFFRAGTRPVETCDFHRELIVRNCLEPGDEVKLPLTVYPDAYQLFVNERPKWSLAAQLNRECREDHPQIADLAKAASDEVRIKRPLPRSIYAVDPNLPQRMQKLKLELDQVLEVKRVEWHLGRERINSESAYYDWPLQKGKHTIRATVQLKNGRIVETKPVDISVL